MKTYFFLLLILVLVSVSCDSGEEKPQTIKKEKVSGFVQKGPFVSGTTVTMNELNSDLVQTGKVFTSTIINDLGLFEVNNIELTSSFVQLTSSGFYFNEVSGEISISPITLTSLSDIKDKNSINVNVLTHLEKRRVEILMKEGKTFSESKTQSRNELLSIFSISLSNSSSFEEFDISKNTEEGGILLAISIILQGNRSVGQLTELLSRIQNDFSDNGKLDDENMLNSLRTSTLSLDFKEIRGKIENRFKELNNNSPVPDFEKQLAKFLSYRDYPLKITIEGEGEVEERIIPNPSGREYPYNTIVELTPKPKDGWVFESWGGDLSGSEVPIRITVDKDKNVTVKFKKKPLFRLGDNGVTCICENVKPGDKGLINGVEYEVVDNGLLHQRLKEGKDLSKVCTSLVTSTMDLFNGFPNFNQPIGNWDVSNVVDMKRMFLGDSTTNSKFNQSLEFWDVGNVINMEGLFHFSSFNQPIRNWNVGKVINMNRMFFGAKFNQPIGDWDVSNVTDMRDMFYWSQFNQPIGDWDVSNVTIMDFMFYLSPFNQPIGDWDVSNITNMFRMFYLSPFNQPIGNWDVSNVTNMGQMFYNSSFNQPIGNWDVSKVKKMDFMFFESKFNQNISKWCVTDIISEPQQFSSNITSDNKPKWGTCPN